MAKVAVVATLRDEVTTVDALLSSLLAGHRQPDEVVIVDAGSLDGTWEALQRWVGRLPSLRTISRPGCGRSAGRNHAIAATSAPWVAVTDGGVRLDPRWLASLMVPVEATVGAPPDVVAGFFRPDAQNWFELALGATTLPELRDLRPARFLPSSRSVAFSREAFAAAGGYPEWLDVGEDLVFDLALRRAGAHFAFAPSAVAFFRPRTNVAAFVRQYFAYARGDGKALLWGRRQALRYASYAALAGLLPLALTHRGRLVGWLSLLALGGGGAAYLRTPLRRLLRPEEPAPRSRATTDLLRAAGWVPILRLVGDVAKMLGYPLGRWWRYQHALAIPVDPTAPRWPVHGSPVRQSSTTS